MKPEAFIPEPFGDQGCFVRDRNRKAVWHRCSHRTLYKDTDRSGVVYHSNYLVYFELGRASLMRDTAYPYREIEQSGFVYPIIEIGVTYYLPLHYDEPFWIHTRPAKLERVKLQFDYLITHKESGGLVCKGFTRHCALNGAGHPVGIDEKTKRLWECFPE